MKTMKRIAAVALMLCILAAMLPMAVSAATIGSGTFGTNINWEMDNTGTLTISGSGDMRDVGVLSYAPWHDYHTAIRKIVIEDGVTSIGERAFYDCSSLTDVTIPDSVWSIKDDAFNNCTALTTITIPDSVLSLGEQVFWGCKSLTSVTLPAYINNLAYALFHNCKSLVNVAIPDGIVSIGKYVFSNCTALTQLEIPSSVAEIGEYAFTESGLTSITLPDGISVIKEGAFYGCEDLTSIVIPESVTSVEKYGFLNCNKLAAVFCVGPKEMKDNMSIVTGFSNDDFIKADWHFEVTDAVLGVNAAKHCGECDLYYLVDGTGAEFFDVSKTSWQIKHVNYACVRGLMAGKGTDKETGLVIFDPNKPISREEFVQVLYNAEGKPSVNLVNEFLDVQNTWYTKAVLWAKSKDIANGTPDGNFGIGKNITRQDLALMLYKYAKMKDCDLSLTAGSINKFADGNKVANYAKTAMDWAVTKGVLSGKGTTGSTVFYLDPAGTATRAECAAMLKNFMTNFGL